MESAQPFRFFTSLDLTLATNRRAHDVAGLLQCVRDASGAAIFFHTHHFLMQHQHLSPEPTNDFAYWVTTALQEDRLGEQLAAIDIIQFRSLSALRTSIATVLDQFLESSDRLRTAPPGEEFHVRESVSFVVPTGYVANDLQEFASCIEHVGFGSLSFHMFEARLRLERGANDFSEWLKNAHGETQLGDAIARLDPYTHTLEALRRQIVRLVQRRVAERGRGMIRLEDYEPIVGAGTVDELRLLGRRLAGKHIVTVNSTAIGGGVAEILNRMVPLCNQLGVDLRWEVMKGGEDFFAVTKRIHNALHGKAETFTAADRDIFHATTEANLATLDLDADLVFIHDPQPAGLVAARSRRPGGWIWRCHIDVSAPQSDVWSFLAESVRSYDAAVFSAPAFTQDLTMPQVMIAPSIDPLSDKNRELPAAEIDDILDRLHVPRDKPIVTQVSRFDRLKDPLGVVAAFKLARQYNDCRLVLAGGSASDDPEGAEVLGQVQAAAANDPDIHILALPPTANVEINALQRASTIVLQKSLKEGFGLTVSEALWKGKPVIAAAVGGIPLQIAHKYSGILTHTVEGTAFWIKQLLNSPEYGQRLGENGREHVRTNFLLTRHLREYLLLFLLLEHPEERVVYLS